jgi:uncharacterized protein
MNGSQDDAHRGRPEGEAFELIRLAALTPWFAAALRSVRELGLPQGCIGAGAVRNLVWDHLHGFAEPSALADVDVAYFDADEPPGQEREHQRRLCARHGALPWEVTNQAHVHLWFEAHFGHAVPPLRSVEEAVASWPETATAVALRLSAAGGVEVIAPLGLEDLFAMRVRRNPARVSVQTYRERIASKRYAERWPRVEIVSAD